MKANGRPAAQIQKTHQENLEEYADEESAPYKMYYMLLYQECIDRDVEFEIDLTPEEKLSKALIFIDEAISRG